MKTVGMHLHTGESLPVLSTLFLFVNFYETAKYEQRHVNAKQATTEQFAHDSLKC